MKKILDNGHIMHYNNHCSAGVAHLVERDLAKVEVASSSLVARSKKKHHPNRVVFMHLPAGQRLEQGTSAARKTCRWHVLVPVCVWRPGRVASEPRRPLQNNTTHQGGVSCIYRAAGDVLTVMQAAQKRRISTTLLCCSEDGARERYCIICCTFSFSLQPLCQWLHRR